MPRPQGMIHISAAYLLQLLFYQSLNNDAHTHLCRVSLLLSYQSLSTIFSFFLVRNSDQNIKTLKNQDCLDPSRFSFVNKQRGMNLQCNKTQLCLCFKAILIHLSYLPSSILMPLQSSQCNIMHCDSFQVIQFEMQHRFCYRLRKDEKTVLCDSIAKRVYDCSQPS